MEARAVSVGKLLASILGLALWAWFVGSCAREPSLISSYGGTPTACGIGYQQHLASLGLGSLG
jgi:hypothetical protein